MSAKAYAKTAIDTAPPRELEAHLLLAAAAKLQAVRDSWKDKPVGLNEALTYNQRLWAIFIDSVRQDDNRLAPAVRKNILQVGVHVMSEIFALMTKPSPEHLDEIIKVNRSIATGLRSKSAPAQLKRA